MQQAEYFYHWSKKSIKFYGSLKNLDNDNLEEQGRS